MKILLTSAALIFALPAFADDVLTVYTSRNEALIQPLIDKFTAETGIVVQALNDDAVNLIARLESEGDATPADVLMPAEVVSMEAAADKQLLLPLTSATLTANIPAQYRDANGEWFGLGKRARVIVYNKETVNPETDLSSYEAMANPKWQGEILVRSSSHPYNLSLIANMIAAEGPDATEAWVQAIVGNLARPPQGGDRDQIKAVAAGEGKIALVNSYYYALLLNSNVPEERAAAEATEIYFPNQNPAEGELTGAHINVSGAGVVAASDSPEIAQQFIEWLSAPEAQEIYAELNQEYPVNPAVTPSVTLQGFGTFIEDTTPLGDYAAHVREALLMTDRSGWK